MIYCLFARNRKACSGYVCVLNTCVTSLKIKTSKNCKEVGDFSLIFNLQGENNGTANYLCHKSRTAWSYNITLFDPLKCNYYLQRCSQLSRSGDSSSRHMNFQRICIHSCQVSNPSREESDTEMIFQRDMHNVT